MQRALVFEYLTRSCRELLNGMGIVIPLAHPFQLGGSIIAVFDNGVADGDESNSSKVFLLTA